MSRVLWPTAYALAAYLASLDRRFLLGQHVIEFGSGIAFPSMVAAFLGAARIIATDIEPTSLRLAAASATQNLPLLARERFTTHRVDFREPAQVVTLAPADVVLCAGQMYDATLLQPLLKAFVIVCKRGCHIVMAMGTSWEKGQSLVKDFVNMAESDFEVQEIFLCEDRNFVHHSAYTWCVMLASRQFRDLASERVPALKARHGLLKSHGAIQWSIAGKRTS